MAAWYQEWVVLRCIHAHHTPMKAPPPLSSLPLVYEYSRTLPGTACELDPKP